jgi:hypothetical protein
MPYFHDYELTGDLEVGSVVTVNENYPYVESLGKKMKIIKTQDWYFVCERVLDDN